VLTQSRGDTGEQGSQDIAIPAKVEIQVLLTAEDTEGRRGDASQAEMDDAEKMYRTALVQSQMSTKEEAEKVRRYSATDSHGCPQMAVAETCGWL